MENNQSPDAPRPLYSSYMPGNEPTMPNNPPMAWPPQEPPPTPPATKQSSLITIVVSIVVAVLAVIAGTATILRLVKAPSGATTTISTTIISTQPTSTPIPPTASPTGLSPQPTQGNQVFSEQWTNGTNGWLADAPSNQSWNVNNGVLSNDGSSCCLYIAPFHPNTHDYALEAQLQLGSCLSTGGSFGLFGQGNRANSSNGGYAGFVAYWGTTGNFKIRLAPDRTLDGTGWQTLVEKPEQIDTSPHLFRVEFTNNRILFFLDGTFILGTTNSAYSGSTVGLEDLGCQITVTNFRVYSLP